MSDDDIHGAEALATKENGRTAEAGGTQVSNEGRADARAPQVLNVVNPIAEASETEKRVTRSFSRSTQRSISFNESDGSVTEAREKLTTAGKMVRSAIPDSNETFARNEDLLKLRNAAASAISKVAQENKTRSAIMTSSIRDCNKQLQTDLTNAFACVDDRIEQKMSKLPMVAMFSPEGNGGPRISPFSGSMEACGQFTIWLRRLEDILRTRNTDQSNEQKANLLICQLEGVAREKVEELTEDQRKSYPEVVAHLKTYCEGPQQKHMARQHLSNCKQHSGESAASFATRVLNLVRAATAGQEASAQKERVLEEFVARLRPEIRYHVKLDGPTSLEKAINRAETVEQLLAEALSDKLINPVNAIEVPLVNAGAVDTTNNSFRSGRNTNRQHQTWQKPKGQDRQGRPAQQQGRREIECYNCGGRGHFSRDCPSERRPPQDSKFDRNSSDRVRTPNVCNVQITENQSRELWEAQNHIQMLSAQAEQNQRDLSAAHHSLSETSSRLQQTTEALGFSQQRCDALVARNSELSEGAFEHPRSGAPGIKSLLIVGLIASFVSVGEAMPALLCPKAAKPEILKFPNNFNCKGLLPSEPTKPHGMKLEIWKPNTARYSAPGFVCRIIQQNVHYSVNFFGARYEKTHETHLTVSPTECKLMMHHRKCSHGPMVQVGEAWVTQNSINIPWPSAPLGCCTENTISSINCILVETKVYARHGSSIPDSPAGDLHDCKYSEGDCNLHDGATVIWTPQQAVVCRYVLLAKMKGFKLGSVWLSETKELALSWTNQSTTFDNCGNLLTITDQGYGITHDRIVKERQTPAKRY